MKEEKDKIQQPPKKQRKDKKQLQSEIKLYWQQHKLVLLLFLILIVAIVIIAIGYKKFNWFKDYELCIIITTLIVGVGNISRRFYVDANASKEVIKRLEVNILANLANIIALAFFVDCVFEKKLLWAYIIGIVFIIVNISSQVKTFLSKGSALKKILPFDILVPIVIAICLLWLLEDEKLQEIATTVVSALSGGFLTLLGVAWTIRRQDEIRKQDTEQREKERKEEEKKKAKPIFTFNMFYEANFIVNGKKVLMDDIDRKFNYELVGIIENSNHSVFSIERIYHDKKWYSTNGNKVILPNSQVYIDIKFSEPDDIFLEVVDSLQNKYYYQIFVFVLPKNKGVIPFMHTIRDIKELTKDESDNLLGQID